MSNTELNFSRTKLACYLSYFTMSSIFCVPPILFVTLRETYNISYTLLGTLVLVNFCTQLVIDMIFTAFSKYFNISKVVKVMPLITSMGLIIYALIPTFFPNFAYMGLLVGTVIFSISAGLSEVLLSPIIAAIPSKNPQRDMSMLHSLYAFGVFTMVSVSSLFFYLFGKENWMFLILFLALLPIFASVLFMFSPFPNMQEKGENIGTKHTKRKFYGLALCVGCIFFGSCAENAMSNWISSYVENALGVNKTVGDILGMAMFAVLLGLVRISYAKFGKNIGRVLFVGMIGASACYVVASLSTGLIMPFVACILTGLFTAMLWPGTLIMMEENISGAGVTAFALMAAGGDLGASVSPQLMGIVIDKVSDSEFGFALGEALNLSAEQVGLKAGMLVSAIFPIIGTFLVVLAIRYFKRKE